MVIELFSEPVTSKGLAPSLVVSKRNKILRFDKVCPFLTTFTELKVGAVGLEVRNVPFGAVSRKDAFSGLSWMSTETMGFSKAIRMINAFLGLPIPSFPILLKKWIEIQIGPR